MKLDQGSEEKLKLIFPDISERWRIVADEVMEAFQLEIRVTEGFRDFQRQAELYAQGRAFNEDTKLWVVTEPKKIVTHAKPGQGMHAYGLAIDICVVGPDPYPKSPKFWHGYGQLLEKHGLTWGGSWIGSTNDQPHCEDKYGFSTKEIQSFYQKSKRVEDVWDCIGPRVSIFRGKTS